MVVEESEIVVDDRFLQSGEGANLSWLFKEFAIFWYENAKDGVVPSIEVLERPDAPPMYSNGVIFSAMKSRDSWDFRMDRVGRIFDEYYGSRLVGNTIFELFPPKAAEEIGKSFVRILTIKKPTYLPLRDSRVEDRNVVRIERMMAPFTDGKGQLAYVGGLANLSYG